MMLWLWDAYGPARSGHGVTDNQARAFAIAEAYLRSGGASVAKVEGARMVLGVRTLTSGYERTGERWQGRCGDSGIRWEQFAPAPDRAAS
jgi:hypothetical protein